MEAAIITLIVCVLICSLIDRIQMIRIEDKIDALTEEIKVLKNETNDLKK